jgi:hypothetical protein
MVLFFIFGQPLRVRINLYRYCPACRGMIEFVIGWFDAGDPQAMEVSPASIG